MKHIIYLIAGLIILLMVPGYVKAASYQDELNSYDSSLLDQDDNDYSSGEYCFFMLRHWNWNGEPTGVMDKGVVECSDGYFLFWVRNKEDSSGNHWRLVCRKSELSDKKKDIKIDGDGQLTVRSQSRWYKVSNNETLTAYDNKEAIVKKDDCFSFYDGTSGFEWLVAKTNIPVFDYDSDTFLDDVNKYLKSGGTDYSGSANSDFIDRSNSSVDKSVDFPHEFQTSQCVINWTGTIFEFKGRDSINASWKVPDDTTYNYQIQMKAMIKFPKNDGKIHIGKNGFEDKWTDWHDVEIGDYSVSSNGRKVCYINPSLMLKLFNDDIHSVKYGSPDLMGVAYDIKEVQFRVRHLKGNKCSNWVSSYIESSGSSNTYLEDDDGNYIDNTEYQGQQTSTDYNSGDFKANDIISFIKSGFGLSGSNGLIAMFKQFFSYLPPSVNVILLTGVAIMVFVAVVKWITTVV